MTTHKYWLEHKKDMLEKHKIWIENNPDYSKKYYQKNIDKIRARQRVRVYKIPRWSEEELYKLRELFEREDKEKLCQIFKRKWGAILSRGERLGMKRKNKNFGKKNGMWANGRSFIYYRRIAFQNLPNKCSVCGLNDIKLEVHHKDKNRFNNIPENLQLVCKKCHEGIHGIISVNKINHSKYARGTKRIHKRNRR